jgi:hypothetical protein
MGVDQNTGLGELRSPWVLTRILLTGETGDESTRLGELIDFVTLRSPQVVGGVGIGW